LIFDINCRKSDEVHIRVEKRKLETRELRDRKLRETSLFRHGVPSVIVCDTDVMIGGSVVVKALQDKLEGRGFQSR
jgi:hypothetical protein